MPRTPPELKWPETFDEFMVWAPTVRWALRTAHIKEPGLKMYVRIPTSRLRLGVDVEIATVDADPMGAGHFTRFLDRVEPRYSLFIENVLESRFQSYFLRRGYTVCEPDQGRVKCFLRRRDDAKVALLSMRHARRQFEELLERSSIGQAAMREDPEAHLAELEKELGPRRRKP